jgi:hypothetical protein
MSPRVFDHCFVLSVLGGLPALLGRLSPVATSGSPKQAILDFVRATTDPSSKDFVPVAHRIPPAQILGSALAVKYRCGKDGYPVKEPKSMLNDNNAGKPERIHLMIGERSHAAFGNSAGDQEMCRPEICLRAGATPSRHQNRRFQVGTQRRHHDGRA